jgi:hypothetical protein
MYERLVDGSDDLISGYVAYGIYKQAKREWLRKFEDVHQRSPTPAEMAAYVS